MSKNVYYYKCYFKIYEDFTVQPYSISKANTLEFTVLFY